MLSDPTTLLGLLFLTTAVNTHETRRMQSQEQNIQYGNDTNLLDTIISRGYLRVGTTGDYKPFSYKTTNATLLTTTANGTQVFNTSYIGADITMSQSLSNALALPHAPVYVATTWANLVQDTTSGNFDIAMGGISVTTARARTAFFSTSILRDGKNGCVRCEDASKYPSMESLNTANTTIVVNAGGTNEAFDVAHFPDAKLLVLDDNNAVYRAVLDGRADVMVSDQSEIELQIKLHEGLLCMLGDEPWSFSEMAYLLPRDQVWKNFVDVWLRIAVEGGAWNRTLESWLAYSWPTV